jgi:hypothetical protein
MNFMRFCFGAVFLEPDAFRTVVFGSLSLSSVSIEASSAIRSIRCLFDSRFAMGSSVSQSRLIENLVYRYGKQNFIRYTLAVQLVLTASRPLAVSGSMILEEKRGGAGADGLQ